MATCKKNDYPKSEDYAMWELHEIRNKMSFSPGFEKKINTSAKSLIKKYGLSNLKYEENVRDFRQLTKTAERKAEYVATKKPEGTKKSHKQLIFEK